MNKKRFIIFANHLEGFTQRIVGRFPETAKFIEAEKRSTLALQASSTSKTTSTYEKVQNTLNLSVNTSRRKSYHQLEVKRDTLEDRIESVNLLSRAIGDASKDILFYSALQGELLLELKKSSTPEGFRLILRDKIKLSKPHVNFLISLFQAPREKREGEGEGTKTRGAWERKRGKEEEPVIILLNTSCRYTSSRYTL